MKPEFGINALAKELKQPPKIIRRQLRQLGIKKEGRYYDFKNKIGLDEVKAKLT